MDRIQEIKEKVSHPLAGLGEKSEEYEMIEYLLAKLEMAERTFSKIEERTTSLEDDTNGIIRVKINRIGQVAKVAREKIRED